MRTGTGVTLVVAASVVLLTVAFVLRTRVPPLASILLAAAAGFALGAGALLVQPHASAADWAVACPALAVLAPLHVRILFGPFGPAGRGGAAPLAG